MDTEGRARDLLARAETFYELLEANRREPFNVFTAIRKSHDEVNLHSRFLHALLSHRDADRLRSNLRDFLSVFPETERFALQADSACVRREYHGIDILVAHPSPREWAVVIENKIWASDQNAQLVRYRNKIVGDEQYREDGCKLLYLTLTGSDPLPKSVEYKDEKGNLRRVEYVCVSYESDILPWLVRCQQRAHDDPALRESVAQYRLVLERLTGRTIGGPYMTKLVELCEQHLPVAVEITQALVEAQRNVLRKLWPKISETGQERLGVPSKALSPKTRGLKEGPGRIEDMLAGLKTVPDWHGLFWPLSRTSVGGSDAPAPALGVEVNEIDGLIYGVRCRHQDPNWESVGNALSGFGARQHRGWWPCKIFYEGGPSNGRIWDQLAGLANDEDECARCADLIADTLLRIREELRKKTPNLFD